MAPCQEGWKVCNRLDFTHSPAENNDDQEWGTHILPMWLLYLVFWPNWNISFVLFSPVPFPLTHEFWNPSLTTRHHMTPPFCNLAYHLSLLSCLPAFPQFIQRLVLVPCWNLTSTSLHIHILCSHLMSSMVLKRNESKQVLHSLSLQTNLAWPHMPNLNHCVYTMHFPGWGLLLAQSYTLLSPTELAGT